MITEKKGGPPQEAPAMKEIETSSDAAFFDIDWTLIYNDSGVPFVTLLCEKGKFSKESLAKLLESYNKYRNKTLSYVEWAAAWGEQLSSGLQGYRQQDVCDIAETFWETIQSDVAPWARKLISLFSSQGFKTYAISGVNIEVIDMYRNKLGFDEGYGTEAESENGIYTGKLKQNLVLDHAKKGVFRRIVADNQIDLQHSFGFGDSEHDRAFLDDVGYPIVINPRQALRETAERNNWPIFSFHDNVNAELSNKIRRVASHDL